MTENPPLWIAVFGTALIVMVWAMDRFRSHGRSHEHEFEARYDTRETPMPESHLLKDYSPNWSANEVGSLLVLESSSYVYDICIGCGMTVGRERAAAGQVAEELVR